jgi:hypothetical protein
VTVKLNVRVVGKEVVGAAKVAKAVFAPFKFTVVEPDV